ncbi:MAG: hypothetical protein WC833_03060 [Bacteroidales bacterium]|jgi:hypothetical protein
MNKLQFIRLQLLTLPVGVVLLTASILMEKTLPSTPAYDFTEGFLMGLSLVMNVYYLIFRATKLSRYDN